MGSAAGVPSPDSGHAPESPGGWTRAPELRAAAGARTSNLDLGWHEVGDALWLTAARLGPAAVESAEPVADAHEQPTARPVGQPKTFEPPTRYGAPDAVLPEPRLDPLPPPENNERAQPTLAVADLVAADTSGQLDVIRALRPLKRKVDDWHEDRIILDEDATADAAQDGYWLPVFKPDKERWLDLSLVIDVGPASVLWDPEVHAFRAQLQQLGAFRTIQPWFLNTCSPAGPTISRGSPRSPARSPAELIDQSGRRMMLVVTDSIGEAWLRNRVAPLLARWATSMPVAVVHLLPQALWRRCGLDMHHARLAVPAPLRPNRQWLAALVESWKGFQPIPSGAVPVPVLELNPRWLNWWAHLITGNQLGSVGAAVLLAGSGIHAAESNVDVGEASQSPKQRVRRFVSIASPTATRLAISLAAAPVTLDVARVLQQEFVPECGKSHLIELFIGGLLRRIGDNVENQDWNELTFDFHDGVRQILLEGGRRPETASVVRLMADRFGTKIRALHRMRDALDAPDITPDPILGKEDRHLVALEGTVMRALSGPYSSRADRIFDAIKQAPQRPAAATTEEDPAMTQPERRTEPGLPGSAKEGMGGITTVPGPRDSSADAAKLDPPPPLLRDILTERESEERGPAVWGDVPPRNPLFTGREDLLDQLSQRLTAGGTTAVVPSALHGMGGIGKTQMAVEYIYRHLADYDIVWWIQAAQISQVRQALTELAQQLGLPGTSEVHAAVPAVREALRLGKPYQRWLLVFDAAEKIEDIRRFFPTNGPGHILITSRNPEWASVARPLEITVFERSESVALLRKRGSEISDEEADALAGKLGDLPLAVEQAAAWRAETGMPVREYLKLFDEKVAEILNTSAPAGYEMPVAAAWNVSFDQLEKQNPAAHQLLQICAFFAPEPITRSLFTGGVRISISPELDKALREPMRLNRAIRDISRFSLAKIDRRNNTLQLHRLVQLVLRNRMSEPVRADMQHGAHTLLANFDPNEPKSSTWWPRYQDIWPHIYSSNPFECDEPWTRQLVINMMQFLYFWGDHDEAAELAREALSRWTRMFGELDSQALEAANYLGLYLWALGRYPEAAETNKRTLELRQQMSGGEDSEETIMAELRVAVDIRTGGDFGTARELNQEIYQKAKGLYGDDDPITLQTAHDLAVSIRLCGDYRAAFELDKHTSERRGEVLGYDSVDTLNTLSGMYMDRRELGEYPRAREEHERILRRVKELLGEDKADTLRRQGYLAVARRKAGDHDAALELSREAIELFRRRYGDDHPYAMACAVSYSIDLRHAGDYGEAHSLGEQTFERYRAKLGERHPNTLAAAVDLAVTLRMQNRAEEARQLNDRALGQLRAALGPDHPYSIVCAIDLASDLAALGDARAALQLGMESLERARTHNSLGPDHPTTLAASLNVSIDLASERRRQESKALWADTVERYRRKLGTEHPASEAAVDRVRANCDIDPLPF